MAGWSPDSKMMLCCNNVDIDRTKCQVHLALISPPFSVEAPSHFSSYFKHLAEVWSFSLSDCLNTVTSDHLVFINTSYLGLSVTMAFSHTLCIVALPLRGCNLAIHKGDSPAALGDSSPFSPSGSGGIYLLPSEGSSACNMKPVSPL